MTLAPVALFAYDRPEHVRRAVEALGRNELASSTDVFVFSDGPKDERAETKVRAVRDYLRSISGFRSVRVEERSENYGLARSIISGVSAIVRDFGTVIVVEDDLVVSRYFLRFMNDGLSLYEANPRVASIHGYMFPIICELPHTFFLRGADCWGWATWHRAWEHFEPDGRLLLWKIRSFGLSREFDLYGARQLVRMLEAQTQGRNNSWAIRWHASAFLDGMYTLYPGRSLVRNIGTDGSGTHCIAESDFDGAVADGPICVERLPVAESIKARRAIQMFFYQRALVSAFRKVRRRLPFAKGAIGVHEDSA